MIRIDLGTASVTLDPASVTRQGNGDLNVDYLVGDLLAATQLALTAASRPELAEAIRKLVAR